jgi:hypothetical protein
MTDETHARFIEKLREWRDPVSGLERFSRDCLKILNKDGKLVPLVFNDAQMFFHERLEEQRVRQSMVRAVVLKGRRQGISTYVAARYYWKATLTFGRKVYILSHEKKSALALFGMVERFQKYNPFAPEVGTDNAQMLTFPNLEGSYTVATAGATEGGRGDDINLFHASETAFWQNADSHFAASVQCVALLPNTEIIIESTSGGPTGKFYEIFREGEKDEGIYQSVFIPWFIQKEYRFPPQTEFRLETAPPDDTNVSEAELARTFDLDDGQMMWRRLKVKELGLQRFNREYPCTPMDAWSSIETDTFINPAAVLRARGRDTIPAGPKIMGVDPAGGGGDRFAIVMRHGNAVTVKEWRTKLQHAEAVQWVKDMIDRHDPDRVNIDSGNMGQAIVTSLRAYGPSYSDKIRAVSFGSPSQMKMANRSRVGPENRRAEMYGRLKEWLEDPEGYASIPNDDDLASDLVSVRQIHRTNLDWLLMSKADMKTRGLRSPDLGDALALTFASKEYFEPKPERRVSLSEVELTPTVAVSYHEFENSEGGWML